MIDLQDVMKVVDSIRKQELRTSTEDPTDSDPLAPVRVFFDTPGAKEGLATVAVCFGVFLPIRRRILRFGRQRNLGDLPDLMVTPAIAMLAFQGSFRVASLCGARTYLERVPQMDKETLSSLCSDPILQEMMPKQLDTSVETKFDVWNPEAKAIEAFHKALSACQQRG